MDLLDLLTFLSTATNKMVSQLQIIVIVAQHEWWMARNVLRKLLSRMGQNHILINYVF